MLTLRLHFAWGRYYAHPWGQNPVRISEAEWPPSPWRLLRAIAAAWFRKHPGRRPSEELTDSLETLGRELPSIGLPEVSFAKTVHYQPSFENSVPKRVRHENHFAAVGGDVLFQWQLRHIPDGHRPKETARLRALLVELLAQVTYFGRAESVCEMTVDPLDKPLDEELCARVVLNGGKPGRRIALDCRDVFCANPDDFRTSDLWSRRDAQPDEAHAPKHLVQDLLDAPQPLPDGAGWYSYQMPKGWPERWVVRYPRPRKRRADNSKIVARYLEFSLQSRIPIPAKHVVSIAGLFRQQAIAIHGVPSFALSGHEQSGQVPEGHRHAFYLPIPSKEDGGRSLSRLIVWCLEGFTQREVNALMSVEALRWAGGRFPARPVVLRIARDLPRPEPGKRWVSLTPFVPPRYWYRKRMAEGRVRGGESPEQQIGECLRDNGLRAPCKVARRERGATETWDVCKIHVPESSTGREPDHRIGVFLELEFSEPVCLPLPAFGHSCHFGLGQLVPSGVSE